MSTKFYEVTKGPALKTIREFYGAVVDAYEARAKLGRKYKAKEVVSCEGEWFGFVFKEGTVDSTVWRYEKRLEAWVPRKGTKEGKVIDKELYNPDTFSPYARSLAAQLGMEVFIGMRMCSPGCVRVSARRYLLTCLDPDWKSPEGVKRITDVEYERKLARRNKKVAK